jgi:hypothetical protein
MPSGLQCGQCGSQVNEGFSTCPACGAVYEQRVGCLAPFFIGAALIFWGITFYSCTKAQPGDPFLVNNGPLWFIGAGVVCAILGGVLNAAPKRWHKK